MFFPKMFLLFIVSAAGSTSSLLTGNTTPGSTPIFYAPSGTHSRYTVRHKSAYAYGLSCEDISLRTRTVCHARIFFKIFHDG